MKLGKGVTFARRSPPSAPGTSLCLGAALLALVAALTLGACTRQSPPSASGSSESSSAQAAAITGGTSQPAASAAATASSSAAEESSSTASEEVPGTASLEQLAKTPAGQQLPDGKWKAGVNYDAIVPAQPTSAPPGKVEVMEVFWLGCPHCYDLEPYIQKYRMQKPSYVQFVRVPVMWGPVHRSHAQLFYTLEALHHDDLVEKAFDTIHKDNEPLVSTTQQESFDKQLAWAQANGIDANTFRTTYNSFGVHASLEHAQEITERYQVEGVPTVIVAGKYATDVGKAGGEPQLLQLIDDLAAFEHQRPHKG
jgi:protein dithiol oxidoreductase (disulfide-forming)